MYSKMSFCDIESYIHESESERYFCTNRIGEKNDGYICSVIINSYRFYKA